MPGVCPFQVRASRREHHEGVILGQKEGTAGTLFVLDGVTLGGFCWLQQWPGQYDTPTMRRSRHLELDCQRAGSTGRCQALAASCLRTELVTV